MTEQEWLTGIDSEAMVQPRAERFTERKGRLLMLACCRRQSQHFADPILCEAIDALAAHYSDPAVTDEPFDRDAYLDLHRRIDEYIESDPSHSVPWVACAVRAAAKPNRLLALHNQTIDWAVWSSLGDAATEGDDERRVPGEYEAQAALVREIVGNPFRPVAFAPEWRTDTALALARQMYAAEDFSAAPILADALQDAGCDSDNLLNHLRDTDAAHVRGCWAVDLVLGKE